MASLDLITSGRIEIHDLSADPSGGGGVAARRGSFGVDATADPAVLYFKHDDADTDWIVVPSGLIDLTSEVTGILPVANGGTGLDTSTVTAGQLLIGNDTNNDFDLAALTAGTNISIVNADGSITINNTAVGSETAATVQTTDATLTTIATLDMSTADTVSFVKARYVGIVSGGIGGNDQKTVSFTRTYTAVNDGGTLFLRQTHSDQTYRNASLDPFLVAASVSGTDLLLRVQGQVNDDVEWKVQYAIVDHA